MSVGELFRGATANLGSYVQSGDAFNHLQAGMELHGAAKDFHATVTGKTVDEGGNFLGNTLLKAGNLGEKASAVINVIPVFGDEVAAGIEAASTFVKVSGHVANLDIHKGLHTGVSGLVTAGTRAAEGLLPGSDFVDSGAALVTGQTLSASLGRKAADAIVGKGKLPVEDVAGSWVDSGESKKDIAEILARRPNNAELS